MTTTAAERLAQIDEMPATELCRRALATLEDLVAVMNKETMLLRAGRLSEASPVTAEKIALAQDYVSYVRSIQRRGSGIVKEASYEVTRLRLGHERLATQMAENLKVLATARNVTESILTDVAKAVNQGERPKVYGADGDIARSPQGVARGIAVNRAL